MCDRDSEYEPEKKFATIAGALAPRAGRGSLRRTVGMGGEPHTLLGVLRHRRDSLMELTQTGKEA